MASPLVAYIEHPESNPGQEELRRIKAFVNWIVISGVSMIINTVSNLFILIGVSTAGAGKFASPLGLFFASALCAYSRIMISFSQVRSSRASGPICAACLKSLTSPHPVSSLSIAKTRRSRSTQEQLLLEL